MSEDEKKRLANIKEAPHTSQDSLMLYSDSSKATRTIKVPTQTVTGEAEDKREVNPTTSGLQGGLKRHQRQFK